MRSHFAFAALALFCLVNPVFAAEQCGPLRLLTTVQMESVDAGLAEIVPVTINGTTRHLLLDTGGFTTQLSNAAVRDLKLRTRESDFRLLDVNGNASDKSVIVSQFGIGTLFAKDVEINISPTPFGGIDGVLSTDFFRGYDIDLDFGANKMNYIKPDHCEGHVIYWKANVMAVVPMHLFNGHIVIPVTVDGHSFNAIVDTGATRSTMAQATARVVYDLAPDSKDMVLDGPVNGDPTLQGYLHTFNELSFEGVTVKNPRMVILPNKVGTHDVDNGFQTGSRVSRVDDENTLPEVLIGMNVLKHLHLYIAYKESKLYITDITAQDDSSATAGK